MIAVDTNMATVVRALQHLPGAAERAMANALNRASVAGRQAAVEEIGERYAVKSGDVRGMISLKPASPDDLDVLIQARSHALSVGYFPHKPSRSGTGGRGKPQLTAEIRRGESNVHPSAFVARLNSGDRVMERTVGKTRTGKPAIKSRWTVTLAQMMGVENVREAVEARALDVLDSRLSREIDRELGRRP